jgi:archaellum component FlaC
LKAQEALIPAEAQRFQLVFTTVKTMGVTVDTLLKTANTYLDVLKKKETEFLGALESHVSSEITGKEEAMNGIDKQIADKAELIRKLNDEMNAMQQQKVAMQNEVSTARSEIEKIKNNFYATLQVFTGKISTDVQKINQYLKGA